MLDGKRREARRVSGNRCEFQQSGMSEASLKLVDATCTVPMRSQFTSGVRSTEKGAAKSPGLRKLKANRDT